VYVGIVVVVIGENISASGTPENACSYKFKGVLFGRSPTLTR
jgi:hypothetical protein